MFDNPPANGRADSGGSVNQKPGWSPSFTVPAIAVFFLLLHPSEIGAQQLTIQHAGLQCVPDDQFAQISALILPVEELRTVKVYFRSAQHPDFYYVEMGRDGDAFQGYLPLPNPETRRVIYYVEAVDHAFNTIRTPEYDPEVTSASECRKRDPAAAWFIGDSPNIIVGALSSGAVALSPGFQAAGITGFISSAGVVGGAGGGIGTVTAVLVAAGAAGTAGVLATTRKGETETTSTVPAGGNSSTAISTTTTTTTTTAGTGTDTTTTTIVGPGSTTTTTAPEVTTTTTTAGIELEACFTVQDDDGEAGCRVRFNASCSTGNIVEYEWWFADNPPVTETTTSPTVTHDWTSDSACGTHFSRLVRLTVKASDNSTAMLEQTINPTSPSSIGSFQKMGGPILSSFTSFLRFPPTKGRLEAQIVSNGSQVATTDNTGPRRHRLRGKSGRNTIEGFLTLQVDQPVFWRFDFTAAEHFVSGSLRIETGSVVRQNDRTVVFRLTGAAGERIRLSFLLSP